MASYQIWVNIPSPQPLDTKGTIIYRRYPLKDGFKTTEEAQAWLDTNEKSLRPDRIYEISLTVRISLPTP